MTPTLHVANHGDDRSPGTPDHPLRTIDRAAVLATPGDTVLVHEGVYREWVRPRRGGLDDRRRITYAAAPGEHVVIKGSERVTGWTRMAEGPWTVTIPNALFGGFNPFAEEVAGDWVEHPSPDAPRRHLGQVYLDGRALFEADDVAQVAGGAVRETVLDRWTGRTVPADDPAWTAYRWFAEVGADVTTVWAHFHDADPNEALVEVNVRRSVFFPTEHHVDYITVRGFEMAQAATPWAPPTADQPGMVGPNWAKGWVIEDNHLHDARCSAVSLGKEASTGHNLATVRGDKPGYQYQLESVFSARQIGWDREHVGSHVVRRNTIHSCGQNAVVGHLGCVFSVIEDNHIYDIATRQEFYGYEIAGIKLHAAIDVTIRRNRIHDCSLGTWLDWQTQGTRVSRNVYYANERDLFVEVSHGPYLVEHNVLASPVSLEVFSQGGAFVHNLVAGAVRLEQVLDRATPYHRPHSTQVAGYATIVGGDDRYVGNLFLGGDPDGAYAPGTLGHRLARYGTCGYDGHPVDEAEYLAGLDQPLGDHGKFHGRPLPVHAAHNVYLAGARPIDRELDPVVVGAAGAAGDAVPVRVVDEGDEVFLELVLPAEAAVARVPVTTGADLGTAHFPDAGFEEPDGGPAVLDVDLVGDRKDAATHPAGPLATLAAGVSRTRVW